MSESHPTIPPSKPRDPSVTPDSDPARDATESDAEMRAEVWDDESPAPHQE